MIIKDQNSGKGPPVMDRSAIADRYAADGEQKILFSHLLDLMRRAEAGNRLTVSGFLTEAESAGAEAMLKAAGCRNVVFFGGYPEAERRCAVFLPDYLEEADVINEPATAGIVYLVARVSRFDRDRAELSHRDCLGSLMALGLERDSLGDLVAEGGEAVLIVKTAVADYVAENLTKIGRYPIGITRYDRYEVRPRADFTEETDTVSSARLDAVTAAVFRLSRQNAADAITAGLVAVNGRPRTKGDGEVREGDKISLRGKGRIVFDRIEGTSQKGRLRFRFRRYR